MRLNQTTRGQVFSPAKAVICQNSFFYPHGFWALGVKVMRRLDFKAKALSISCAFLVPIVFLSWVFLKFEQQQISFTRQERLGVQTFGTYVPIMHGLLKARNATRASLGGLDRSKDYQQARTQVDQALRGLEQDIAQSDDPLNLRSDVAALKSAWVDTAAVPNGVDAQGRTVFGPVVKASIQLLRHIGDRSNLVLDPDLDSFYLTNTLVLALPRVIDEVGQLWGWSSYSVAKGGLTGEEYRRYAVWDAGVLRGLDDAVGYLNVAAEARPSLSQDLNTDLLAKTETYRRRVSDPSKLTAAAMTPEEVYDLGEKALDNLVSFYESGLPTLDGILAEREHRLSTLRSLALLALLVFLSIAAYLFYSFYLVTRGGLRLISQHLNEMATGDLRRAPGEPWGRDEPAMLIRDLRLAYDSLRDLTQKVGRSAAELHHAASQISDASLDLSARTEVSAASLEEQAAVMAQISVAGQHTAASATEAARVAQRNADASRQGGEVISAVVEVMNSLNSSSKQIEDIIGVIDGIAFQTNILALNAAVEAARAGEQGRGFAVVASEVRALAQRSASAAKEIKSLITSNMERAERGEAVVREAGSSMQEILAQVIRIHGLVGEIADTAQEQAAGVAQAGQAIHKLDQDTQQNAAMVEQTSATANLLKDQADALLAEVSNFKL
ncbi:methyl-accepting chemotaxis protein [Curvibacter sp. HBC61]|uniref:Methyl-accepting chemotaxis protein n=1 Tax=Curvibacter cyanobacteriorum TaxID=3026422 RepID=A0ABT5N3B6_9BURK|nr:methyl-accepting chemotaxis protein [Curvibacter sp. HBC61]MDD0840760.1 methyl-accepting chemotaxis protein [Curvibacter sp. HBC61]